MSASVPSRVDYERAVLDAAERLRSLEKGTRRDTFVLADDLTKAGLDALVRAAEALRCFRAPMSDASTCPTCGRVAGATVPSFAQP